MYDRGQGLVDSDEAGTAETTSVFPSPIFSAMDFSEHYTGAKLLSLRLGQRKSIDY